ncbi:MAG: hypothetical protein ACOCRB_02350 [Halanaerobiaceae bacterium]
MKRKIIFSVPISSSIEKFKKFVQKSAALGATHVQISNVIKSRWQWERNLDNPYPNWNMNFATIFKIFVPEELREWLPVDYAQKNMELISKKRDILEDFGLKATFYGCEPMFLPEEVFRAHPEWRGPRCDQPRRATEPHYSPCIDHPEILSMYQKAVREICRKAPIDTFILMTNDSGGGICWSSRLYPGQNGPEWCKNKRNADRVKDFLATIQKGAGFPEKEIDIQINKIPSHEALGIIPYLDKGQAVNNTTSDRSQQITSVGQRWFRNPTYPVKELPDVLFFEKDLEEKYFQKEVSLQVLYPAENYEDLLNVYREISHRQEINFKSRTDILHNVAVEKVDEKGANLLLEVWNDIYLAIDILSQLNHGGTLFLLGGVNQRWITRPLVPFPEELNISERDYYRKYQFQATTEEDANDLMNMQATKWISGYSGTLLLTKLLNSVMGRFNKALTKIKRILTETSDENIINEIKALESRLKILKCLTQNAINTSHYQEILDSTEKSEEPPEEEPISVGIENLYPEDPRWVNIHNVVRREIDNTKELIEILNDTEEKQMYLAPSSGKEDIFLLGPDIIDQLKKKINIMLKHKEDHDRLYIRPNP